MTASRGERYLTWAFVFALLLHGLALVAAARLPAELPRNDNFDEIRVFDEATPVLVSPVELVQWSEPLPVEPAAHVTLPEVARPTRPKQPTHVPPALPIGRASRVSGRSAAPPQAATPRPHEGRPGGGGGGGPINLGSPSARGDLLPPPSGQTPLGSLPGTGEGSGSGVGPGVGSGSGGGSGSGSGPGLGSGQGPGEGSGAGSPEGGGGGGFVSRVADRLEPEVVARGTLDYPASAAAEGVEGTVRLRVVVTETGAVSEVQVVSSSGDRRLDEAARDWVKRWRYRPAVQNGQPRRVQTHATVEFELR